MTLRDERDNCLDELATFAEITYKEDVDGMMKVSIEGMEFVDEARVYEMGKLVDEIASGNVEPNPYTRGSRYRAREC